ncbi:MAG: hypothetical protein ACJ8DQ_13315 [Xanthobacteraceae bacterium]|jgi:hypothetical protein
MALKSSPFREGRSVSLSGAVASPSEDPAKHPDTPPEISLQAKEHLARIDKISADVLRDLQAVSDDIGKLREEIMLRARVLGEATLEFDELARTASQGYGSIRKAIEMVRQKFAGAMSPTPAAPAPELSEKNGRPGLVPDVPA